MKYTLPLLLAFLCMTAAKSRADIVIFQEDFETTTGTDLPSGWTVLPGKFGVSTDNPLASGIDTSSRVFSFSSPTTNQDTFSPQIDLSAYLNSANPVILSFDFLSSATTDQPGLIGLAPAVGGSTPETSTFWLGGSPASVPGAIAVPTTLFSGTGAWESVQINLNGYINSQTLTDLQTSYLSFERWNDGTVNSSADVYFDNLKISVVPEPSAYALIFGCCCVGLIHLRRK